MYELLIIVGNHNEQPLYGRHKSGLRPGTSVRFRWNRQAPNCMSCLDSSGKLNRHAINNDPVDNDRRVPRNEKREKSSEKLTNHAITTLTREESSEKLTNHVINETG